MSRARQLLTLLDDEVVNPYSPDFAGLTRYEWTVESLALSDDDLVDSLTDVAQGIELTAAGAERPTFKTDGTAGACLRMTNQSLVSAGSLGLDFSGGLTVFVVAERTTFGFFDGPVSAREDAQGKANNSYEISAGGTANAMNSTVGREVSSAKYWATNDAAVAPGTLQRWAIRMDASLGVSDSPWLVNGAAVTVTETGVVAPPTGLFDVITIGEGYNGAHWPGDIYAIVLYGGAAMTLPQVQAVDASLATRFAA